MRNRAALELAVGLALPATLGLIVLSAPIVRMLFEHGLFTAADTEGTARALIWLALGLPAYVLVKALSPAFFARDDTGTPLWATLKAVLRSIAAALVLGRLFGASGIAAAHRARSLEQCAVADPARREHLRVLHRCRGAAAAAAHRAGGAGDGGTAVAGGIFCAWNRRDHPWPGAGRGAVGPDRRRDRGLRPAAAFLGVTSWRETLKRDQATITQRLARRKPRMANDGA